jgi:hypothetical protein
MGTLLWVLGLTGCLFLLDRFLLWVESRGWIYYRRTKPGRGAATYHLLEWNAVLDPTMRQVQEERIREEKGEEESGAPPAKDDPGGVAGSMPRDSSERAARREEEDG